MAVAGINNVSVLESSYFGNQEKPVTRTSFIRKLWRDLDDEMKNRETERKQTNVNNNNTGSRCSCSSEGAESENMSTITSEAENEYPLNQNLCLQQSPAIGSADKERVRQVFREWGNKNVNNNGRASNVSHSNNSNNSSRARMVCDTESMRVRTVRQWLESYTQQAEICQSPIEEQDGLGVGQTSVGGRKSIRLLYGRHALLDLLTRFEMERKEEVQILLESRPVSTFAHRKRIKALLKGRFLLNQRFVQDKKPTSTAASELGYLRQSQTVSDLRKGFLSRVNSQEQAHDGLHSDTSSINGMRYQENQVQEDIINESDTFSENGTKCQENQVHEDIVDESDTSSENDMKYPENQLLNNIVNDIEYVRQQQQPPPPPPTPQPTEPSQQSLELKSRYESNVDELELEADETLDRLNASETETDILSWQEELVEAEDNLTLTNIESTQSQNANSVENQDDWMYQENVHDGWYDDNYPVVTTDAFYIPDDDTDNNIRLELQRLTSRRRVSNLLQSGFRVRLNHVLQSYLARQHQASESDEDWMLEHQEDDNDEVDESTELGDSWQQHPEVNQQSATDLEIINGLRMDMVMLQERVNSMQSALETCMKMQLELQRSVQQEVSLALNRPSNSGEESLQSCFLCCDSGSDFSPNRCGHVYVCANCAEKINWSTVKESVRHP